MRSEFRVPNPEGDEPRVASRERRARWPHPSSLIPHPFRREEGQATFEFLLILPAFFLFFLLMVDLGLLTYSYVSIANATREGARFAAVNCGDGGCTTQEVVDRVIERSGGLMDAADAGDVTVAWDGVNRGSGVTVSVDWPYDFLFFPASIDVRSCADMRLEQADSSATAGGSAGCN